MNQQQAIDYVREENRLLREQEGSSAFKAHYERAILQRPRRLLLDASFKLREEIAGREAQGGVRWIAKLREPEAWAMVQSNDREMDTSTRTGNASL